MAKIKITENSPLKIEFEKDDGTFTTLHIGDVDADIKDFRLERLTEREVVISIGKSTASIR